MPNGHRKGEYPDWKKQEEVSEEVLNYFYLVMPRSLKRAIRCFILNCAIRKLRGVQDEHNSMLIHVSRFQNWQSIVTAAVQKLCDYYRLGIDQNDFEIIEKFRVTFEEDSEEYKSFVSITNQILNSPLGNLDPQVQIHSWNDILNHLNSTTQQIKIRSIHGGSGEILDYYDNREHGLSVIAIGGNKLSRGLTLEGLSVSYYLRASRMYDTLMQMGRWFGYRPGYVDLCRLYTSRELNEWFCHITNASEELREEFDYMSDIAGSTPEQYALRVRTHPGSEIYITASNKLRNAVTMQFNWAGRLVESYEFSKDADFINGNLEAAKNFIQSLPFEFIISNSNYLWCDVTANQIIGFLNNIRTLEKLKAYDPQNLIRFINMQLSNDELTNWTVVLMSKKNTSSTTEFKLNKKQIEIGCFLRRQDENNSDESEYYLRKSHIISPKDEFIDLTNQEYERAMQLTREMRTRQKKDGEPAYPNGEIVRNQIRNPKNPLMLIYLLDPCGASMPKNSNPFLGYAISFPKSNHNASVAYAVNEQLLDKFYIDDNPEDYGDDED